MKIEKIKIKNYKVFKDIEITDIPSMCVFLGANGSGKSTLFDVFGFLSDSLKNNVKVALNKRGGFKEVISREQNGDIEFEIKFRNENMNEKKQPLITYSLRIGLSEDNQPIVIKESLSSEKDKYQILDFSRGEGEVRIKENKLYQSEFIEEKQILDSPDILAIKVFGQLKIFKEIASFRNLLENLYISNIQIEQSKLIQEVGISEQLSTTGDNLAQVTQYIYENHIDVFNLILEKMKQKIPGISNIETKITDDGRIVLKFQDATFKDPFIAKYVSDGTLKMFAYLILLNAPNKHPLLCIEEPENFLHPDLLSELAEEFREYSLKGGQVFVSTHSPDFVNALDISELFWITKKDGYSYVSRAIDNQDVKLLFEEGDKLGYLWNQKYLRGSGL
ncbi:MAG: AAA family ATPase [Candidatus Sericytochromatia bacterium]